MSTKEPSPRRITRPRTLTSEGAEFIRERCLKNKELAKKKISKLIRDIENNLECDNINNVVALVAPLDNTYEEFNRFHMRYREHAVVEDDPGIDDDVSQVASQIKKVKERVNVALESHQAVDFESSGTKQCETTNGNTADQVDRQRQHVHTKIEEKIENINNLISENNLVSADEVASELETLFCEFVSLNRSQVPWYPESVHNAEEHLERVRALTHEVDSAVFSAKKRLAEAKAQHEITQRSSPSMSLYNHGNEHLSTRSGESMRTRSRAESEPDRDRHRNKPTNEKTYGPSREQPSRRLHPPQESLQPSPVKSSSTLERYLGRKSSHQSYAGSYTGQVLLPLLQNTPDLPPRPRSQHSQHSKSRSGRSLSRRVDKLKESHRSRSHQDETGSQYSRSSISRSSRSRSSSNCSSSSSTRAKAIEERAHLESLKVEARFLEISQKKEAEKRSLEMEFERLEMEREIAIAEAKAKVYDSLMPAHTILVSDHDAGKSHTQSDPARKTNENEPITVKPPQKNSDGLSHLNDLCNFLKVQSAPNIDMDYFSGDPLDYQYFISLFEELIERKIDDPFGKLARLIKYTRGEAKDLIQHCCQMPQPDGYILAKELLEKEYGDPHKVTSAYMRELDSWKIIRSGNVSDFKKFYRFLLKCNTNRKGDVYLRILDNPETLRNLQSKLPLKVQERWARKAVQQRENNKKELDFSSFLEFVRMECKFLDDPMYSQNQVTSPDDRNKVNTNTKVKDHRPERQYNYSGPSAFASQVTETHCACLYCAEEHDIDTCAKFLQLTIKEKKAYLYQQKICFYCYGPFSADKHGLNKCEEKRTCKTCNQAHPTALHKDDIEKIETSRAIHAEENAKDTAIGMPILPVKIYHRDNPSQHVVVYAMLDNCSSGVFILQDCVEELGLETNLVPVLVRTVVGVTKCHMKKLAPGLMVRGVGDNAEPIEIKKAYSKEDLSIDHNEIVTIDTLRKWDYLDSVTKDFHHYGNDIPIAMIIGSNVQKAVEQIDSIPSREDGPFAFRTQLGWCVAGPVNLQRSDTINCNRIRVVDVSSNNIAQHQFVVKEDIRDVSIADQLEEMYAHDFNEKNSEKKATSVEDEKFLRIMESEGKLIDNHYHLPLPLRNKKPNLPNNRVMAVKRTYSIKRRMLRDEEYRSNYVKFISTLLKHGHAQKVDPTKKIAEGMLWYVPHHGVYHPKTKKFRVVMACNAEYQGRSLNTELFSGPDNTNLLFGVLLRFRQKAVPYMGDIEQMFYQIMVPEEQRSLLRFLWWPDGDINQELIELEMCVHLFGAVSSPAVAGYALRKTATDNLDLYGEAAARAVIRNFYVDDLGKSEDSVPEAISMIGKISALCAAGGFNLTKLISSNREVLNSIPIEKRAKELQMCDLSVLTGLPAGRALGVVWNVEGDTLGFRIQFSQKALSRRTVLSDVSSIYDPDGRGCAFVLPGKKILQEITGQKKDWDAPVSVEHAERWNIWKTDISSIETMNQPRCLVPAEFGKPVSQSLHCFSDGSTTGYGQATYLRSTNISGQHHVALVTGKSRVAPLKSVTIPRLELTAATVSVKVGSLVIEELDIPNLPVVYWTDSTIVLGYIDNETTRFNTFERNRINTIHRLSQKEWWRYVPSEDNPADFASRGLSPKCSKKVQMWFNGPPFLWKNETEWPENIVESVQEDVEENPIPITACKVSIQELLSVNEFLTTLEIRFSSWYRLIRTVAVLKRFVRVLKEKKGKSPLYVGNLKLKEALSVVDIQSAETQVIKLTQQKYLPEDVERMANKNTCSKKSNKVSILHKLNPFMDCNGLIRVGGRLRNSEEGSNKHPIVIPKKSKASFLLVKKAHEDVAHCGRCTTLNKLREEGYWVIGAHTTVKSLVHKCRRCRELRGKLGEQKMADLPPERVNPSPPFTYCGADMFGPFFIKEGRKEVKRYGCIFTCMSCRAVHIEVTSKLDADTFIQALRRFVGRRGQVRSIRTDNGTNFIGAENELKKALKEMDHTKIQEYLAGEGCDWIVWEKNPPEASHMGGVWERQIRSVRTILTALMKEHSTHLNEESLRTFMVETEAIINSRPLTVDNLSDPDSPLPLSPIQLLTFKSNVVFPPPGKFERPDIYSRKHWRRVQYLANQFWSRWRTEYLSTLQARQKWTRKSRNFMVGDVVLVKDSNIFTKRNGWPLALVEEVFPGNDGLVRHVKLRVAYKQLDKTRHLSRPISKLVLLVGADENNNSSHDTETKEY